MVMWALKRIREATIGHRFPTVQKVAHTLGGLNCEGALDAMIATINNSYQYNEQEAKYIECATVCYNDGVAKSIKITW